MTLRDKSDESLRVAEWCRDNAHYNRAVSSAYYAAYQALHHELDEVGAPYDPSGWTGGLRWEHATLPGGSVECLGLPERLAKRVLEAYDERVAADYHAIPMTRQHSDRMIVLAHEVREWINQSNRG